MTVRVYYHERCSKCGDIRGALKRHNIEYKGHHFPPENTELKTVPKTPHPDSPANFAPVLVHGKTDSDSVIGYEEILDWIKNNHGQ